MIKNIPDYLHLQSIGRNCISRSILTMTDEYIEYIENVAKYELYGTTFEEFSAWNYLNTSTSIILLHQGMEAYMKALICKDSPFLLIDEPHINWPVSPSSRDKDFNSLFQISGIKLITVFSAIYSRTELLKVDSYKLFDDIRILRNEIVHSDPSNTVETKIILSHALRLLNIFENGQVLNAIRDNFFSNPLIQNNEERKITFRDRINSMETIIGKKSLSREIDFNLKARRYHCPDCSKLLNEANDNNKYVLLKPNDPRSTLIECLICGNQYSIVREDCSQLNCPGNVIYITRENDSLCLTCFNYI